MTGPRDDATKTDAQTGEVAENGDSGNEGLAPRAPQDISGAKTAEILARLQALGDEARATRDKASNRTDRETWGVAATDLADLAAELRAALSVDGRVVTADAIWNAGAFDARLLALRMMTQARIRPDVGVWARLSEWVFQFDCRAVSDAGGAAISRRVMADLSRLDVIEDWTTAANIWTRRSAFTGTNALAKLNHPSDFERNARERVLGWASAMTEDTRPVIRQAIDGWLRDLRKHDPERVKQFEASGT